MITGDSKETAIAIGRACHIVTRAQNEQLENDDRALSGAQVEALTLSELQLRLPTTSVFYRTCPRHKLKIVRAFQANEHVVAMTG